MFVSSKQTIMKNILLSASLVLITSIASAQNRGGGNATIALQSNLNNNINTSNVYSNVATLNNNPINVSNRRSNVNVSDNNVNIQQRSNVVVRTRPENNQSRNVQNNGTNEVVISRGNRNVNYVVDNNNEEIASQVEISRNVANVDIVIGNVVPEVQTVEQVQVEEIIMEKPEVNFSPDINIDISLPKPNITFDLKVKEEKEEKEKVTVVKSTSGNGVVKVKSKTRKNNNIKGRHQYSQKVKFSTALRKSIDCVNSSVLDLNAF